MFHSPLALFGAALMTVVCLLALIMGSGRERTGAAIYIAAYIVTNLLTCLAMSGQSWWQLMADGAVLVGFVILAWKSPHPWPLWAAGCQLASFMTDVETLQNAQIAPWAYLSVLILSAYGVLLALLIGTFAAMKRRKSERLKSQN
jgi:hypothetical protein